MDNRRGKNVVPGLDKIVDCLTKVERVIPRERMTAVLLILIEEMLDEAGLILYFKICNYASVCWL